jgi:Skp family chaperone for outer membrane proteins
MKDRIKTTVCALAVLFGICAVWKVTPSMASKPAEAAPVAPVAPQIAYLDLNRALNESADGKKISADLRADAGAKQKQIEDATAEAKKSKSKAKQASVAQLSQTLEAAFKTKQSQIQEQRVQPLISRIMKLADEVGRERRVVVLFAGAVAYGPKDADLTDEVIRRTDHK